MFIGQRSIRRAIFLAAMCYQAIQQFTNPDRFCLPKGFTLVKTLQFGRFFPNIGYIAESDEEIIVAFRGTETNWDRLTDLSTRPVSFPFVPQGGEVARGFLILYRLIRFQLGNTLGKLSSQKRLFVTGHSLGGALATMAALDIAVNTKFKRPIVYTFASPRVGTSTFADTYNRIVKCSFRIYNVNDLIPRLPLNFTHVQKPFLINFRTSSIVGNHRMTNYFAAICRLDLPFCKGACHSPNMLEVCRRFCP
ncbi:lipase family protein [Ammoniphilus sp. YIM 78166]|uniref:lipase family protein n=1 Tax=Ammoniphilus sp. YIM 78166 TaxID=1644106 RepID=UPI00106FC8A5|nr:lipase family protein [Ammoniphilus sp. YIM 78166]